MKKDKIESTVVVDENNVEMEVATDKVAAEKTKNYFLLSSNGDSILDEEGKSLMFESSVDAIKGISNLPDGKYRVGKIFDKEYEKKTITHTTIKVN